MNSSSMDDSSIDYDQELFMEMCSVLQAPVGDESSYESADELLIFNLPKLFPLPRKRRITSKRVRKRVKTSTEIPNDSRRFFSQQKLRLLNAFDVTGLREWMEANYDPNVVFTERFVQYLPGHRLYVEIHGIEQLLQYHAVVMQAVPDITGKITNSRLTLRQDGTSYLVVNFISQGTYMQQFEMTNAIPHATKFLDKWNVSSIFGGAMIDYQGVRNPAQELILHPDFQQEIIRTQIRVATSDTEFILEAAMQENPTPYLVECTVVMYINAEHKIYREEFLKKILPTTLKTNPFDASQDAELFGTEIEEEFVDLDDFDDATGDFLDF